MVDSNDKERITEAKDELNRMLAEDELRSAVLLVFANKQVRHLHHVVHQRMKCKYMSLGWGCYISNVIPCQRSSLLLRSDKNGKPLIVGGVHTQAYR